MTLEDANRRIAGWMPEWRINEVSQTVGVVKTVGRIPMSFPWWPWDKPAPLDVLFGEVLPALGLPVNVYYTPSRTTVVIGVGVRQECDAGDDDIAAAPYLDPPLTTVAQKKYALGQQATN